MKNTMKKWICTTIALTLCLSLFSCSEKEEKEATKTEDTKTETLEMKKTEETTEKVTEDKTKNEPVQEEQNEPTYYAAAIEGAVIVSQNPTERAYTYCYKCEKCGDVQDNMKHHQYNGGNLLTSYYCTKCKSSQKVCIEQETQW